MKRSLTLLVLFTLLTFPAFGGVVFEVESTNHRTGHTDTSETMVEGKNLAMEVSASSGQGDGKAIFRGDRNEMVIVDDDEKTYTVVDKEMLAAVGGQVNQAMAQVQEALKNVPEDQRAMVEEMLKQRMGDAMGQAGSAGSAPKSTLHKTGEKETHNGYSCTKYEIRLDGRRTHELCITPWDKVEGSTEARDAFVAVGNFAQEMIDSLSQMTGGANLAGDSFSIYRHFQELDGFPVVTRSFSGDELTDEAVLRSSTRRTLDPADFEPPAGYKRRSMPGF